jgi:hypothetical protein
MKWLQSVSTCKNALLCLTCTPTSSVALIMETAVPPTFLHIVRGEKKDHFTRFRMEFSCKLPENQANFLFASVWSQSLGLRTIKLLQLHKRNCKVKFYMDYRSTVKQLTALQTANFIAKNSIYFYLIEQPSYK